MEDSKKVNAEVLAVLITLGDKYISKIPTSVIKFLKNNSDIKDMPFIDASKRIEEQNISKDARAFLTMLKLKYWCKSEEEKEQLLNLLNDNEKKYQEEINSKYNPENLFKKN